MLNRGIQAQGIAFNIRHDFSRYRLYGEMPPSAKAETPFEASRQCMRHLRMLVRSQPFTA